MVTFEWADSFTPVYVTLDEVFEDGSLREKETIVTKYNTADQTLDNKEILFTNDEDDTKHRAYIDEPYQIMEDLYTNIDSMQAYFEIKKG